MKKRNRRRWLWAIGSLLALLLLGIGAYNYSVYHNVKKTADLVHEPVKRPITVKRPKPISLKKQDPISILLIGVDERRGDRGRSDSLIVLTVNPNKKSIKMLSIPRDTRTKIVGKGIEDKINHAYAFGGVEMTMSTVEKFLAVPIDYYIKVNMEGFRDIVNAIGGITVNNQFAFTYEGVTFPKGEITLDGQKALKYSRMRYEDPRGDFGRQNRQKQIIEAVIHKGSRLSSLVNYQEILTAIGKNVKTNITFEQMKHIQTNYKDAREHVEQLHIKGHEKKINGTFYLIVPEQERLSISKKLKEHLEISSLPKT
jgi:polyisoprenyl-teichoic acid--peptidoglycan teichoic acid transferase